jgi:DNA polymerase III subunit chi
MTRIDFYSNAESRLQTVCQLVAKAFFLRMPVAVFAPDAELARSVDRLLWTFQATSFVPHCLAQEKLAAETPVVIVSRLEEARHDGLVVNLAEECPPTFSRFRRLIEVVGREEQERRLARVRWRFYKERGYEVNHVELGSSRVP